ncbi:hypothetical protein [Methylobacterium aerolatum]|uniref:Uncharacterized protein n=1 Tax=Methylobacterium aerolatum TaxID=418708 RepID=A0ABU0HXA5_9HYPH|nr:hypothetical protein [Methylobacterium aerolatum]MDQ0446974.1 hypothetical protein [Methylobacterium aerolatum]GJD36765.1 hypothetical protein FMGBMHLM_3688 [Methylobacterium aerolatum]
MTRSEIEDGAAWARRTLRKPEPITAERKPNQTERIAAWMAENRKAEGGSAPQTRSAVEQTRRDLTSPGSSFTVGAERYAADGSRWKRVA